LSERRLGDGVADSGERRGGVGRREEGVLDYGFGVFNHLAMTINSRDNRTDSVYSGHYDYLQFMNELVDA
jgi:hypothetical protein